MIDGLYDKNVYFSKKLPGYLPKWLQRFAFPPAVKDSSYGSTCLSAFADAGILDFPCSIDV